MIGTTKNNPIIIKNNFFDDPNLVIKYANSLNYFYANKSNYGNEWPGKRTICLSTFNKPMFNYILNKICVNYNDIKLKNANVFFHKIKNDTKIENGIHIDNGSDIAGVIYLNEKNDFNTGTTLYFDDKTELLKIGSNFNTMISYDSKIPHSPSGYHTKDKERLTIVFFLELDKTTKK